MVANPTRPSNPLAVLPPQSAPVARTEDAAIMALERVVTMGDLRDLTPVERVNYYLDLCQSLGLNPRSRPFDWILFKGENETEKLSLYPNSSCMAQLRNLHRIRVEITRREVVGEMFVCEARGTLPDGRTDTASKYVPIGGTRRDGSTYKLSGAMLANAFMRAETGAKRRLTLSIVGLAGIPDREEGGTARHVVVDGTGQIIERPTDAQRALASDPAAAAVIGEPTYETTGSASAAPFHEAPHQRPSAPQAEPSEPQKRQTFACDAAEWRMRWDAVVAGSTLATPEGAAAFITAYTSGWRRELRASDLDALLARLTDAQAEALCEAANVQVRAEYEADVVDGEFSEAGE